MAGPSSDPSVTAEQLAALSHEFRTPLNGVLGMARLLGGTRLTAEQRAYVEALRQSGEHLLGLVNDLLDLAKLGAGGATLYPAPVDVEDLLRGVSELLSPRADEKGVEVAWAAEPGLPQMIADGARLKQVLLNFAGNAVKFTSAGGVLLLAAKTDDRLRLEVHDTGPGVAAEARARIFDAFEQADPAADMRLGGAGLGLAVVRRLAAAMDAEVGVDTAPLGGARFWFEAAFPSAAPSPADRALQGRRIGVASLNPVLLEGARRQIEACGGQAVTANSVAGLEALLAPGEVRLVDRALTGVRSLKAPSGGPALILLHPGERGMIARSRRAGFAGYLVKPLRRASLAARVLAALGADDAGPAPDDERAAPAALPGARVLLAEDNPINAMLARALLQREGCAVTQVASGHEAVDAASAGVFDLILMDLRMPGLSGLEATRRLRAIGLATPIVALTADAFDEDRRACLAAGMDDFTVKPLGPDALRALLLRWTAPGWTSPAPEAKVAS